MSLVIASHEVKDYDVWRPLFDADNERRTEAGLTNARVYRSAKNANDLWILFDCADVSVLEQMANDPEMKEKMEAAGVISEPVWTVLNEAHAPVTSN